LAAAARLQKRSFDESVFFTEASCWCQGWPPVRLPVAITIPDLLSRQNAGRNWRVWLTLPLLRVSIATDVTEL